MKSRFRDFFSRFTALFRRKDIEKKLQDELEFHLEMRVEDNLKNGMSSEEARRHAHMALGGMDQTKEAYRETGAIRWLEAIARDARYGIRMFRKNPGFSLAAIITLALCIGANTAIFSMLDALVFKPLPFHESDRMVSVYTQHDDNSDKLPGNITQYLDFKENVDVFEYLALWEAQEFNLVLGDDAYRYPGAAATSEIFDVLGLNPVLGRFFSKENDRTGENREMVLTQRFWKSHFQEDPGVIGRTIQVDSEIYEVVGIAPKVFESFNAQPQFIANMQWTPQQAGPDYRYAHGPDLLGRLKPNATIGAASSQMTALERHALDIAPPMLQENIDRDKLTVGADTLQSIRVEPDLRLKLYLLQGAVLFVLLIGCVNVTNLFLSRSNARQGELAVRIALGSGRRAIARQLLVDNFLLTWLGTVLGIALALGIVEIINVFTAQLLPESLPFAINSRLLVFTAGIATLTALVIGLFQVFHVFGSNLLALTQNQSGRTSNSRSLRTMSGGLVVAQMAITLVLLIGGGLLIRSFANLLAVDPGFNPQHIITARISLPSDYWSDSRDLKFRQQLEDSLRNIPGFTSISLAASMPYNEGPSGTLGFQLQDYKQPESGNPSTTLFYAVDSSYLETMQIPLIEGRWFNAGDTGDSRPVCVVSQDFARRYVSGRSAVGKHVTFNINEPEENWPEIIGVIGSVRDLSLEERQGRSSLPAIYRPVQQNLWPLFRISVAIRSPRPAPEVIALLREKVKEIDPVIPLFRTGSMESIISTSFNERRMIMFLLCSFAGTALLLSAVGIYGVLAYDVSKRTHEIGIRGAIGATDKQITRLILRQGLWKVGIGLVIGMAGAFYLSNFMSSLLFDVKPTDPLAYVSVSVLLLLVALLASYLPARSAARIDPIIALRSE